MSKEKFNWKGLFINDEETSKKDKTPDKKIEKAPATSFPESAKTVSTFPKTTGTKFPKSTTTQFSKTSGQPPSLDTSINHSILNGVIEMYEAGFESLNQPGYDFYEFFKAIKAVGSNDPAVYKMAFTMAQSVDAKVSKDVLLTQADYYIKEIEKVHNQYHKQGNSKKSQIVSAQKAQKDNLTSEISDLERQLLEIQTQIAHKRNQLDSIDSEMGNVAEIDQKIAANDTARTKILETIMTVVDGIKNNI
ncbi:hypothetical protein GCM10022393_24950 [Aquimarina addita]|uniref:Uncharacterized protein n=1 Tax=Aquimarina addita TaxID=870485 RepID=A0ABP6UNL3_9FLAO